MNSFPEVKSKADESTSGGFGTQSVSSPTNTKSGYWGVAVRLTAVLSTPFTTMAKASHARLSLARGPVSF